MVDATDDFMKKVEEAGRAVRRRRGLPEKADEKSLATRLPVKKTERGAIVGGVELLGAEVLDDIAHSLDRELEKSRDKFMADIRDFVGDLPEFKAKSELRVVTDTGEKIGKIKGLRHKQFETLVKAASIRGRDGNHKNILLKGPMGGGKSTAGKQLAELFDLPFDYIGQTEMPSKLEGYVHPVSHNYVSTPFVNAFSNGGVVMLEEMDSWSPRATLVTNVPLANGYMTTPDGVTHYRHPDCIIIACANTWGTGATAEYVGRNKLDAAFLDRFSPKMDWEYDYDLERAAANNDNVVDLVQAARGNAFRNRLKVAISPRSSINIADMVAHGFTLEEACEMDFLAGCDNEQRRTLLDGTIIAA